MNHIIDQFLAAEDAQAHISRTHEEMLIEAEWEKYLSNQDWVVPEEIDLTA